MRLASCPRAAFRLSFSAFGVVQGLPRHGELRLQLDDRDFRPIGLALRHLLLGLTLQQSLRQGFGLLLGLAQSLAEGTDFALVGFVGSPADRWSRFLIIEQRGDVTAEPGPGREPSAMIRGS